MNKIILVFAIFIFSATAISFADQAEQVITLKDGSQIIGELSGIDNGVYTVKTPIIGDVHVAASDVASITNGNAAPVAALPTNNTIRSSQSQAPSQHGPTNRSQQKQLMSNPQSMATLRK